VLLMGEYVTYVNLDKKEVVFITPAKFSEQFCSYQPTVLLWLLTKLTPSDRIGTGWGELGNYKTLGRWAGDRVMCIGDYHPLYDELKVSEFKDITCEVIEEIIDYCKRNGFEEELKYFNLELKIHREVNEGIEGEIKN